MAMWKFRIPYWRLNRRSNILLEDRVIPRLNVERESIHVDVSSGSLEAPGVALSRLRYFKMTTTLGC